jgi:hypothetical protein
MRTDILLDRNDRKIVARSVQDVDDILERNKALRSMPQPPRRRGDWGRHIASIPNVILVKWLNEEYISGNVGLRMYTAEFNELVQRKLQDPDWAYLRTDK